MTYTVEYVRRPLLTLGLQEDRRWAVYKDGAWTGQAFFTPEAAWAWVDQQQEYEAEEQGENLRNSQEGS